MNTANKFAITKENVEEIIDLLYEIYNGRFEKDVIRTFFGEGTGDDWQFEPEWFEEAKSIEQICEDFELWAVPENL